MYQQTTHDIEIKVTPKFMPEQSADHKNYCFSYEVEIINHGHEIVQLLNRHWIICDDTGHVEEVKGPGVIGLQPIIKPGENFVYASFCLLATASGSMKGTYEMQNLDREKFIVNIPEFVLRSDAIKKLH